ncbi:MAG: hypothetical protein NTW50_04255 [Candidatus Berkelbacteria bacterium]|nr:hypothetical protein [Candidatus Berkelbacteria bacterium]
MYKWIFAAVLACICLQQAVLASDAKVAEVAAYLGDKTKDKSFRMVTNMLVIVGNVEEKPGDSIRLAKDLLTKVINKVFEGDFDSKKRNLLNKIKPKVIRLFNQVAAAEIISQTRNVDDTIKEDLTNLADLAAAIELAHGKAWLNLGSIDRAKAFFNLAFLDTAKIDDVSKKMALLKKIGLFSGIVDPILSEKSFAELEKLSDADEIKDLTEYHKVARTMFSLVQVGAIPRIVSLDESGKVLNDIGPSLTAICPGEADLAKLAELTKLEAESDSNYQNYLALITTPALAHWGGVKEAREVVETLIKGEGTLDETGLSRIIAVAYSINNAWGQELAEKQVLSIFDLNWDEKFIVDRNRHSLGILARETESAPLLRSEFVATISASIEAKIKLPVDKILIYNLIGNLSDSRTKACLDQKIDGMIDKLVKDSFELRDSCLSSLISGSAGLDNSQAKHFVDLLLANKKIADEETQDLVIDLCNALGETLFAKSTDFEGFESKD